MIKGAMSSSKVGHCTFFIFSYSLSHFYNYFLGSYEEKAYLCIVNTKSQRYGKIHQPIHRLVVQTNLRPGIQQGLADRILKPASPGRTAHQGCEV